MTHDTNHLRQVEAAQRRDAARRPDATSTQSLLGHLIANPTQQTLGERIALAADRIKQAVNDRNTDERIYAKVARAQEEGRIAEGEISTVLASLHLARNRGAYFVAAIKKVFDRNELSWHSEDWK